MNKDEAIKSLEEYVELCGLTPDKDAIRIVLEEVKRLRNAYELVQLSASIYLNMANQRADLLDQIAKLADYP
jgi:hypothetical protein